MVRINSSSFRVPHLDKDFKMLTFSQIGLIYKQTGQMLGIKVRKRAKIRNRYNQSPHLTQDTNGKVTTTQLDSTNESQEVSLFPRYIVE